MTATTHPDRATRRLFGYVGSYVDYWRDEATGYLTMLDSDASDPGFVEASAIAEIDDRADIERIADELGASIAA